MTLDDITKEDWIIIRCHMWYPPSTELPKHLRAKVAYEAMKTHHYLRSKYGSDLLCEASRAVQDEHITWKDWETERNRLWKQGVQQ